jgi:hypothetical protein
MRRTDARKHVAFTLDLSGIEFIPADAAGNFADFVSEDDTLNLHKS